MPTIAADNFELPFSGSVPLSRHNSAQGAKHAADHVGRQCIDLLTAYRQHGSLNDWDAAQILGIERSSVNARRRELIRRGLVVEYGSVLNSHSGLANTAWGLTSTGAEMVPVLVPPPTDVDKNAAHNKFQVSAFGQRVQIGHPKQIASPISRSDALLLAAWLVTLADTDGQFLQLLERVKELERKR